MHDQSWQIQAGTHAESIGLLPGTRPGQVQIHIQHQRGGPQRQPLELGLLAVQAAEPRSPKPAQFAPLSPDAIATGLYKIDCNWPYEARLFMHLGRRFAIGCRAFERRYGHLLRGRKTASYLRRFSSRSSGNIHPGISQDTAIALSDQVQLYPRQIDSERGIMRQLALGLSAQQLGPLGTELPDCRSRRQSTFIRQLGVHLAAFASSRPTARWTLPARTGPHPESAVQLARLGWQTLDIDQAQTWPEHIPLPSLPVPGKLRQRLQSMGFNRVSDLLALPSAELAKRFPMELKLYLDRLMGRRPIRERFGTLTLPLSRH